MEDTEQIITNIDFMFFVNHLKPVSPKKISVNHYNYIYNIENGIKFDSQKFQLFIII